MKTSNLSNLSNSELITLIELSSNTLGCDSHSNLTKIITHLNQLIDFDAALYAHIDTPVTSSSFCNKAYQLQIHNVNCPEGFVNICRRVLCNDAAMDELTRTKAPVHCQGCYPVSSIAADFGLVDGWLHGTVSPSDITVFFYLGRRPIENPTISNILTYITPFLASAYKKIICFGLGCRGGAKRPAGSVRERANLTKREIEVLNWIKEGKSSWEISTILELSKRTVDFHADRIKEKLGATTRPQAVAVALANGYIDF